MKTFGYSFAIDGDAKHIEADNVFQARTKILEQHHAEAYVVWEERYGIRVQLPSVSERGRA